MGATQSSQKPYILSTPQGSLRGIEASDSSGKPIYQRYARIPFAQPPTGQLRFRRPQALPKGSRFNSQGSDPGDYSSFGPVCPQPVYALAAVLVENKNAAAPVVNVQSEDCLYLNVWVPAGKAPAGGWPVQFFIHGGWLQVGDAMQNNGNDPLDLLADTGAARIIVAPTHRLNLFGFLSSKELAELHEDEAPGNYGFWDQRMALEWTQEHIRLFGGNKDNISVGGLSAGAYSSFFQLYYDAFLPKDKQIIKRVYLWSNAVGVQPNRHDSETSVRQFDGLISHFGISPSLSAKEKIAALRNIPSEDLIKEIPNLKLHTFRATTDDSFIPSGFLASIHSGTFSARLKENGTSVMLGEVADEGLLYRLINPPTSEQGLVTQLENYYPPHVVRALLSIYSLSDASSPATAWQDLFGRICGDNQVHAMIRGLTHSLLSPPHPSDALPISRVHRYRIRWRARALDRWLSPSVGVCHGGDGPIWWASGWRLGFEEGDKEVVRAFLEPFGQFLRGERVSWGTSGEKEIREMGRDGRISVVQDENWDWGMKVWDTMWASQKDSKPKL